MNQKCNFPFPQQKNYLYTIKPNNFSQEEMNESVSIYYNYWKKVYLKKNNDTTPYSGYLIEMKGTGGTGEEKTTSEAHGYGMIIFALMAGYDDNAKEYFDGMFNVYNNNRSTINKNLMSWIISKDEDPMKNSNSATDGDLDIAYSLLLADKQWGSDGDINYMFYAREMIINGIQESLIDENFKVRLGDWANIDKYQHTSRPSDWMLSHFTAFKYISEDEIWDRVIQKCYEMIENIQNKFSKSTGLLPDFIVDFESIPSPPNFLEDVNDGNYNWNSCRVPWRLATNVIHNVDKKAKCYVQNVLDWIISETNGDLNNIYNGYTLEGLIINKAPWNRTLAFISPFVTASTIDSKYQKFLNDGWEYINNKFEGAYFDRTVNLLNMLLITGNWWKPNF